MDLDCFILYVSEVYHTPLTIPFHLTLWHLRERSLLNELKAVTSTRYSNVCEIHRDRGNLSKECKFHFV